MQLTPPAATDAVPDGLAVSSSGVLAVGYGLGDPAQPAAATAGVVGLGPGGATVTGPLPRARQILGLAYLGPRLEVLARTTPPASGLNCCSGVETVSLAPGGGLLAPAHVLLRHLGGTARGALLPVGQGLLALVGTASGVWVAQANSSGRFRRARRLALAAEAPAAVSATAVGRGRWLVAWSASPGAGIQATGPSTIVEASGGSTGAPRTQVAVALPAGHTVDQLALASGRSGTTLAFTDSWYDRRGGFHSRVEAEDDGAGVVTAVSAPGEVYSGLSLAAAPSGGEVLAWQACDRAAATCTAEASVGSSGRSWSAPVDLGPVDPASTPAAIETSAGTAVVGWIEAGDVWVTSATSGSGSSTGDWAQQRLSHGRDASSLILAAGPAGTAVAAWSAGFAEQSVMLARYQP